MKEPIYDNHQKLIGYFLKDSHLKRIVLEAIDGNTYSVPDKEFTLKNDHWVLAKPLTAFIKLTTDREQQERVDEMSDESFPASDPPDFTLGKN